MGALLESFFVQFPSELNGLSTSMSSRIVPCDACGNPIRDSDLETGQAVTLLGKRYCGGCKGEAIQNVSLDDLSGAPPTPVAAPPPGLAKKAPAPAPRSPAVRTTAAKPAPAPALPPIRADRKAASRRAAPSVSAPSRTPWIAGIAGAVLLLGAGGAFVAFRASPEPPPTSPHSQNSSSAASGPAATPDARAREAFLLVQELAGRSGASAEIILAAAEKARGACRGTSYEKPLDVLITKAQRDKEGEEAARELAPLIDELKGAVATDSEFKRYSELQPKFQLAIETAAKSGSTRVNEIRALQNDYNSRYEKLAEPYYTEIHEAAVALADERRYDDAIRKIETFPQQLRNSGTWTTLQKLRQDIERRKKK